MNLNSLLKFSLSFLAKVN